MVKGSLLIYGWQREEQQTVNSRLYDQGRNESPGSFSGTVYSAIFFRGVVRQGFRQNLERYGAARCIAVRDEESSLIRLSLFSVFRIFKLRLATTFILSYYSQPIGCTLCDGPWSQPVGCTLCDGPWSGHTSQSFEV